MSTERLTKAARYGWVTPNGVAYEWGLAGPDGAWYTLLREARHTDTDISNAQRFLRNSQDVVRMRVERVQGIVLTRTHTDFWNYHKRPVWQRLQGARDRADAVNACINAHARVKFTQGQGYATTLCSWIRSWERRIGQYPPGSDLHVESVAAELLRLSLSPFAHQAPRRSAFARRWYYRLHNMKAPRQPKPNNGHTRTG